jgi:hypothetical protein
MAVWLGAAAAAPAQTWVELTPGAGPAPAARRNASAVFDPVENRMVVFGGWGSSYLGDIWAFDLDTETWSDLTPPSGPAPAPRLTPASVYDPFEHRMLTWSGQGQGTFFNDVWEFDLAGNAWALFSPTGGPPNIRYGAGSTFDPVARHLVTFAGFTNMGRFHDVWRFDGGAAPTWSDVSPATGPEERCLHSACYDAQSHRMIMYGGQRSGPLDDIWALDLDTNEWTDLTPAVKPSGRYFTALVYDAANHRATVFGGLGLSSSNETWVFDLWTNAWTLLSPSGTPPSARYGSAGIYDGANDRMIVFGGFDTAVRNDVWAIEDLSGTFTGAAIAPASLTLHPNHPNPFNPLTTIRFEVPAHGRVSLRVYDVRGKLVRTLVDAAVDAGAQRVVWDGRDAAGVPAGSGVYFYRLDGAGQSRTRKMVLLK